MTWWNFKLLLGHIYITYRFVPTGTWIITKVPSGVLMTANMTNRVSFIATNRRLTVKFYDTLSVIIRSLQRRQTYISLSCSENANSRSTFFPNVYSGIINGPIFLQTTFLRKQMFPSVLTQNGQSVGGRRILHIIFLSDEENPHLSEDCGLKF